MKIESSSHRTSLARLRTIASNFMLNINENYSSRKVMIKNNLLLINQVIVNLPLRFYNHQFQIPKMGEKRTPCPVMTTFESFISLWHYLFLISCQYHEISMNMFHVKNSYFTTAFPSLHPLPLLSPT